MAFIATTITEHIRHEAEVKGEIKGKVEGKVEGKIEVLESLYLRGILSKEQFEELAVPLRLELSRLLGKEQQISES